MNGKMLSDYPDLADCLSFSNSKKIMRLEADESLRKENQESWATEGDRIAKPEAELSLKKTENLNIKGEAKGNRSRNVTKGVPITGRGISLLLQEG